MLTGVVDIGKTHARLVLLDPNGQVVHQSTCASPTCTTAGGWRALDSEALWAWLREQLSALGRHREALTKLIVTTHGAAVAAVAGDELVLPIADYEFEGFDERPASLTAELDAFEQTLSPLMPRGLNMGVQLDWLSRHEGAALARADGLMPYPQYWAWRLSGVRASEVSSLGCHTLMWKPRAGTWSDWAVSRGWSRLFAPVRPAWEVLGILRPSLARSLGLRPDLQVHVGAHDSNACLARWLRRWPRTTLVSSGTWVVVMAPGADGAAELANVSVRGEPVPTARFMGGRELQALCGDADPRLANLPMLEALIAGGKSRPAADLPPVERATAAALYVAQKTAQCIERLAAVAPDRPVLLEGPLAGNPVVVAVLAALLPPRVLHVAPGTQEGTVIGSFLLANWVGEGGDPAVPTEVEVPAFAVPLRAHYREWLAAKASMSGAGISEDCRKAVRRLFDLPCAPEQQT